MTSTDMTSALIVCFIAVFVSSLSAPSVSAQETIIGQWQGVASRQGADLPIEFNFLNDTNGLKGFVTARTLGGLNFPLRNVSFDSLNLRFELPSDAGVFRFSGSAHGDSLTGSWNLFGFESHVSMRRTLLTGPAPYTQVEAKCRNGDVQIAGTLFIPTSRRSQHPAMVFLHGSGTVTRDANRFLADHFARRGVATLIFDKRGSGASTGDWREADFNDLARDALACVQFLKSRRDIDERKIGLIGASQAGWVAPLAASMSRDVAFMVLISAPTVTVAREGWWDAEFRLRERGFTQSEIEQALMLLRMNDEVTRSGRGLAELQAAVERARGERWFGALESERRSRWIRGDGGGIAA